MIGMGSILLSRHGDWSRKQTAQGYYFLLSFFIQVLILFAETENQDAAALQGLSTLWKNTPSNWKGSDPCGDKWVGITCNNSRIISITLSSLGLEGTLSGDIQSMTELQALDLSYNKGLNGGLPVSIGKLSKLVTLILVGCSFSGEIPLEIGSLSNLVFLSLNSNGFTGRIPPTIGNLSKLYWLDLADNQLTGSIPVSDGNKPGLDLLKHTKHFHFGMNQLSGMIPSKLFSSDMQLIHMLFDNNKLSGSIPATLGLVQTLEVLRLDNNELSGAVPSNFNNLTKIAELHLANNQLTGPLPNLTGMNALNFVDMSNNTFDPSDVPPWFSTLPSLTSLYLEKLRIRGEIPQALFSNSPLQIARLRSNNFNGTLDIGSQYSTQLKLIDLRDNDISAVTLETGFQQQIILVGNPVCKQGGISYCTLPQQPPIPYSTPLNCMPIGCPSDQTLSPNCNCSYPYMGTLYFRSPSFSDLQNSTTYQILQTKLMDSFLRNQIPVDSIYLGNSSVDVNNNLEMALEVFPSGKPNFEDVDVLRLGFILSNQTFKPPQYFGPYYFIGQKYLAIHVGGAINSNSNHVPVIVGTSIGAAVLVLVVIGFAVFAVRQKREAKNSVEKNLSFGSFTRSSGSIPKLKGARFFSFDELKKSTNNFSEANEIGNGGYGKVYRGTLSDGQLVAVKRAKKGATQGAVEFNNEIELLSRVHHKNLVSLVGFCFEQDEQILVYEYIPNGTLGESLLGKSGVHLDWKKRLRVALGAARGLAYLHELATPPIVHRDIKSSNILLDDHLNAKVSDFGLSKPMGDDSKDHVSTQVKGTMGYVDPEYYMTEQLTEKSDVYSFGVLLLEMLTARKPLKHGCYVVREVRNIMDKTKELYGLHELLDPVIGLGTGLRGFERYVDLAMQCVEESGAHRPTMSEAVKEIESIMQFAGMSPEVDSPSTSLSNLGSSKSPRHPYGNDSFDYSGARPSPRLSPK